MNDYELHEMICNAFGKYTMLNKISLYDCELIVRTMDKIDNDLSGPTTIHNYITLKPVNNKTNLCESCKEYISNQDGLDLNFEGIYQYVSVLCELVKGSLAASLMKYAITTGEQNERLYQYAPRRHDR